MFFICLEYSWRVFIMFAFYIIQLSQSSLFRLFAEFLHAEIVYLSEQLQKGRRSKLFCGSQSCSVLLWNWSIFICYMTLKHERKQETKHFVLISNNFFLYFTSIHTALLERFHVNSETTLKQRRNPSITLFAWSFKLACLTSFPPFSGYFSQAHWLQNWADAPDVT